MTQSTLLRGILRGLAGPAIFIGCFDLIAWRAERQEERNTPRIDGTEFAVGSEVLNLGPFDSEDAVLLVHGFVGGSDNFGKLPKRLAAKGWRVRAMRLPGHGTTPRDFAKQTPESLLESVRSELAELKQSHERVHIVGHSMGGALATQAASLDGAQSLVIAAPAFGVTHRWYYILRPETWTRILAGVVPWVYKGDLFKQVNRTEAKPNIYSYRWVPSKGLLCLQEVSAAARSGDVLSAIECPVLLIHAKGDAAADFEASTKAFEAIGSTEKRLITLEKSNHHVFWDYEREEVYTEIEAFLDSHR